MVAFIECHLNPCHTHTFTMSLRKFPFVFNFLYAYCNSSLRWILFVIWTRRLSWFCVSFSSLFSGIDDISWLVFFFCYFIEYHSVLMGKRITDNRKKKILIYDIIKCYVSNVLYAKPIDELHLASFNLNDDNVLHCTCDYQDLHRFFTFVSSSFAIHPWNAIFNSTTTTKKHILQNICFSDNGHPLCMTHKKKVST